MLKGGTLLVGTMVRIILRFARRAKELHTTPRSNVGTQTGNLTYLEHDGTVVSTTDLTSTQSYY